MGDREDRGFYKPFKPFDATLPRYDPFPSYVEAFSLFFSFVLIEPGSSTGSHLLSSTRAALQLICTVEARGNVCLVCVCVCVCVCMCTAHVRSRISRLCAASKMGRESLFQRGQV
jgi:hypothetical protein